MSRKGFDPDDAALDNIYIILMPKGEKNSNWQQLVEAQVTPMIYYAMNGNVKMCRYLISRGASSTKTVEGYLHSPMQTAAKHGHLDICKLLFHNGDKHHIRSVNQDGLTPFHFSVYWSAKRGHDDFVRWFVLHGALCSDDDWEDIVGGMIHSMSYGKADITICTTCSRLVDWSKDVLQAHSSVITFLLGTQPPIPDNDRECILQCLSGHPGIRKSIADFVGLEVTKTKQLHILRSVVEVLPETMRIGRK